ncbi:MULTISPECIES: insulinase family protein [Pseudoalteromonas]|uniref:Protease 3 n=1 Tax=Pseudoalteromonas amylolytica TaxID=1859457 RepID=A0A1S1N156_9GAMM|nr:MULTISPECIES: insulinase family protein [Pseudoalteromonas]OHU85359.1 peptidase M16 [Pseudoalteromonas sp. JW3]OHU93020.1 peptidase M16 [Pseudoalteromonas amylolytica]
MKKLVAISVLSLAVMTGCSSHSQSGVKRPAPSVLSQKLVVSPNDDRAYQTLTLENGIEVILVSDPSVDKSAAALSVGVGLLQDPMTQQGMAHYLEHMLFLGTERFPDSRGYSDFMTENGGAHNAYTWLDITNYMFKVNNNAYDEALDRFSDFFKSPKLYPEYTEKEKNAVNAEWSMRREMDFFGQFKLARNMLGEHPANRFLPGNLETLGDKEGSKLHAETVAFYQRYYSANIMKLAMISSEPLEEMEKKARKHFSTIENKNIEKPTVTAQLDFSKIGQKRIHYKPNEDVKQLKLDFTIKNNIDQFAVKPNYFVTYLLSNEMQGSPAQVLKEQGLISSLTAGASPDLYGNYGVLSIDISLTDKGMQNRELIVATVMQYIELIKHQGIDSKYFDEIRTSLNNQFLFLEKGDEFGYVSSLTDSMQKYPVNHAINANYYYAEFDKGAVKQVLNQLDSKHLRVWYISKEEPTESQLHFYDGKYKITDIPEQEIASWSEPSQMALQLPSINRLLPEQFAIKTTAEQAKLGVQKVYEQPGLAIWHTPSERFSHQPKGSLHIYINSPKRMADINTDISLALWSDLFAIAQSKLQTEALVAGMSLSLTPSNGMVMRVAGFTDKQSELLTQSMKHIRVNVSEDDFTQAVDRYVRSLLNEGKQFPIYQAFGQLGKMIQAGQYDTQALIDAAQSLTLEQFNAIQDGVLRDNQVRVFSYGNYNQDDLNQVAQAITDALPEEKEHTNYVMTKYWQPKAGETLVWQQDIDVADVAIIDMHVHPKPGYKQKAAALILQNHLKTNIFDTLRTEEQLAYAVGATVRNIDDYSALGFYIQTPVMDVQSMQARFDTYKQEYAKKLAQLDEATFAQLKSAALVSLNEEPKNLSDELSPLLTDWYRERFEYDSKEKLVKAVELVELKDVQSYYQQTMLNPDAARLNIQMRGTKFTEKPFAQLPKQTKLVTLEELYKRITLQ